MNRPQELPRFNGNWKCVKTSGEWDIYLRLAGVDEMKIHLAKGTLYGKVRALRSAEAHSGPFRHAMLSSSRNACSLSPSLSM